MKCLRYHRPRTPVIQWIKTKGFGSLQFCSFLFGAERIEKRTNQNIPVDNVFKGAVLLSGLHTISDTSQSKIANPTFTYDRRDQRQTSP